MPILRRKDLGQIGKLNDELSQLELQYRSIILYNEEFGFNVDHDASLFPSNKRVPHFSVVITKHSEDAYNTLKQALKDRLKEQMGEVVEQLNMLGVEMTVEDLVNDIETTTGTEAADVEANETDEETGDTDAAGGPHEAEQAAA